MYILGVLFFTKDAAQLDKLNFVSGDLLRQTASRMCVSPYEKIRTQSIFSHTYLIRKK